MPPQPSGIIPATGQLALRQVRRQFPQFAIWREITLGRSRYIAHALNLGTNPHTVITDDLAELRDALLGMATSPPKAPVSGLRDEAT